MRSSPIAAIMRSSSLPERPTKARPSRSSSRPGASPTNITRACGLPSANTSWVAVARSAQPSNRARIARRSSRLAALRAASRAAMTAASGEEGAPAAALASGPSARRLPVDGGETVRWAATPCGRLARSGPRSRRSVCNASKTRGLFRETTSTDRSAPPSPTHPPPPHPKGEGTKGRLGWTPGQGGWKERTMAGKGNITTSIPSRWNPGTADQRPSPGWGRAEE